MGTCIFEKNFDHILDAFGAFWSFSASAGIDILRRHHHSPPPEDLKNVWSKSFMSSFFLTTLTLYSSDHVACHFLLSSDGHDLEDSRRADRRGETLERMLRLGRRRIFLQCHHSRSPDQQQFRPRGRVNLVDAASSSSTSTSASPCRCSTSSSLTALMIASV